MTYNAGMVRWLCLVALTWTARAQEIRVDPRLELFSAIGLLADYDLMTATDTPYRRAMAARFQTWRRHAAVQKFADARRRGFSFDAPVSTMACLSDPPDLRLQANPSDCGSIRFGGDAALRAWVDDLRDFSRISDFPAFFSDNAGLYAQLEEGVRASVEGDVPQEMERYFGKAQASYAVMLNPLLTGNYGLRVPAGDGRFRTMISIAATGQSNGVARFQTGLSLRALMWHEFGHSYINPVIEPRAARLRPSESLFPPIRERMERSAYGNWQVTVIEHVVRAAVARLMAANVSESAAAKEILRQRGLGFAYVGEIAERLKEFESYRESGAPFDGFAERLLAVLDEIAGRQLPPGYYLPPYAGTINSALEGRPRVFIVPTAESDPADQAAVRAYVEGIRDRFSPAAPVLDDVAALTQDLHQASVIAYGTVEGNLWIRQHRESIPVSLQGWEGANLRLIVSFPNPANAEAGVVLYSAAAARDVVGINSVFHGPTAYVIADGSLVRKAGDYGFDNGVWVVE